MAVRARRAFVVTEKAAQKLAELISEGVHVVPQRSFVPPYVTVLNVVPQVVPVTALFVPTTVPPFTNFTTLSRTPSPRVFADPSLLI